MLLDERTAKVVSVYWLAFFLGGKDFGLDVTYKEAVDEGYKLYLNADGSVKVTHNGTGIRLDIMQDILMDDEAGALKEISTIWRELYG